MTSTEAHPVAPDDYHVLDLFAGPGGLDVAAHFLGVESLGLEWDQSACETRYAAGLPTFHADVSAFREERFHEIPETINVLAGGPPCQTYSVAGSGTGRKDLDRVKGFIDLIVAGKPDDEIDAELERLSPDDRRTGLVLEPLRWLIKSINVRGPESIKAIVLEQVPAVEPVWHAYADVLEGGGLPHGVTYSVQVGTLRTEEYGVPQTRKRAVLIARLVGSGGVELPKPTHHRFTRKNADESESDATLPMEIGAEGDDAKKAYRTMGEALAASRTGNFTLVSNYGQGGDPKKRGRRTAAQPAFTVTGKASRNVLLPDGDETRRSNLTIPEAGILQTFPANYPWSGGDKSQQVGNAVPPLFGMHVINAALGLGRETMPETLPLWTSASSEETKRLRDLGCGDESRCPGKPS